MKLGDVVKWTSQAGGNTTEKTGKIVYVIRGKQEVPLRIWEQYFPHHKRMFDGMRSTPGKKLPAYLVEVGGKTPQAKDRLYMPYPSKLKLMELRR